jgi:hypothetical protein
MCRIHPKSTHPLRVFFVPDLFFTTFSGVFQRADSKTLKNLFEKIHVENILQKKREKFRAFSVFIYYAFLRFSSWGVQNTKNIFVEKNTGNLTHTKTPPTWAVFFLAPFGALAQLALVTQDHTVSCCSTHHTAPCIILYHTASNIRLHQTSYCIKHQVTTDN